MTVRRHFAEKDKVLNLVNEDGIYEEKDRRIFLRFELDSLPGEKWFNAIEEYKTRLKIEYPSQYDGVEVEDKFLVLGVVDRRKEEQKKYQKIAKELVENSNAIVSRILHKEEVKAAKEAAEKEKLQKEVEELNNNR